MSESKNKKTPIQGVKKDLNTLKEVKLSDVAPVEESMETESLILPSDADWNNLNKRILAESEAFAKKKSEMEYTESLAGDLVSTDEIMDSVLDDETEESVDDKSEFNDLLDDDSDDTMSDDELEDLLYDTSNDSDEDNDNEDEYEVIDSPEIEVPNENMPKVKFSEEKVIIEEPVEDEVQPEHNALDDIDLDLSDLDSDIDDPDLNEEYITEEKRNEIIDNIKKDVNEHIKPINNKVDFSKFKVSKSVTKTPGPVLSGMNRSENLFTWFYTGFDGKEVPITMTEFTGIELLKINRDSITQDTNIPQFMREMLQTMYNHVVSPKPKTMAEWARTIPAMSLDDLFFTVFGATYSKSNHIFYRCEKCGNSWMTESLPILSLVKNRTSKEVNEIIHREKTEKQSTMIEENIIQVTDDLAFSIKLPSLYSSIIEINALPESERNKMVDTLPTMMCIGDIYYINRDTMTLEKVSLKVLKNPTKSLIARYRQLDKFLEKLTPDQSAELDFNLSKIIEKANTTQYILPEQVCGDCGHTIKSEELTAENILFIRHHLGAMRS